MKTSKVLGFLTALMLLVSVSSCTTYVRQPYYGRHYGYHRQVPPPPPPRPYGGYGYGRPGW